MGGVGNIGGSDAKVLVELARRRRGPEAFHADEDAALAEPPFPPELDGGFDGDARGGVFIGMEGFGASAPAGKLYEHFGITPAKVADAARKLLSQ